MPLINVNYEDENGLWWVVKVPLGKEDEAAKGIPVGPPDLSSLGLPPEVAKRLHNGLFHRRLITRRDIRGRAMEVVAALQAAYRVDAVAVTSLYR